MKKAATSHHALVRELLSEPPTRNDRMMLFVAATVVCGLTAVVGACLNL